jgi:integrase
MTPILLKELRPGKWYIVYHANGKRWVRKVSDDRKEAEQIRKDLERLRLKDGYKAINAFKIKGASASALTIRAYADRWLVEMKASGLKPSTKDSYELQIERHIKPHFGDLPLADVTYARLKEFISDKRDAQFTRSKKDGARTYGYSRDSIRIMLATLRAMLEEALREELINENPVRRLGKLYAAQTRRRDHPDPFSIEDLHRIEAISGEWLPFLMFQARTGVRVGEAIALQWQDIDFEKATAIIRRTMPGNRQLGAPKTMSSYRTVEMSPQLVRVLQELQKSQREYWFCRGEEMPHWVFCKQSRNAPIYSVWRRAFVTLLKKAGVRIRRVHDIRHTWASQMLLAGKPLAWVSLQLGHKSPAVTLSIYTHWVPGENHGARDILDNLQVARRQQTATEDSK